MWEYRKKYFGLKDSSAPDLVNIGQVLTEYNPFVRILFLNEYMIASIFFKHRYMMSRVARLTILWLSLLGEVIAIGAVMYLTDFDRTVEAIVVPPIAVACVVWVGPVFTRLFKIATKHMPKYSAGNAATKKDMVLYVISILWMLVCTGATILFLREMTEADVHWWVIYWVYTFAWEMLVIQLIKAAVKYKMLKPYERKRGGDFVEFLRMT
jgi:hypothetical protein